MIERVPAGMVLLCGRVVGVDVSHAELREHLTRSCEAQPGGLRCVDLVPDAVRGR